MGVRPSRADTEEQEKMCRGVLCLLLVVTICQAQEDGDNTETRILSNQNTAAVTGAALGLGIGIAGSILVGKLIEDATKCKPQDVQPPAFGRFLPDLLNLNGGPCHTRQPQSSYRQPQPQQYPSPGYVIPSPSTQYQQAVPSSYTPPTSQKPTVTNGYTPPTSQKPTVISGYNVPNLHKQTISSGYSVPNLHKPTVSNGYKLNKPTNVYQKPTQAPKNIYAPVASSQNLYTQTSPHKASVDAPKDAIELVNHDYNEYNDFTLTPNFAIQPRTLAQEDLAQPGKERKPKSFNPRKQEDQSQHNAPNAFTLGGKSNLEQRFSQAAVHKPKVDAVKFESSPRDTKTENQGIFFEEADVHKSVPEAPRSSSSLQARKLQREAKQLRNTKSIFQQTESHKAEPDAPLAANRQGKSLSNLEKSKDSIEFDPVPVLSKETKKAPFIEEFQPISGSVFSPVPKLWISPLHPMALQEK